MSGSSFPSRVLTISASLLLLGLAGPKSVAAQSSVADAEDAVQEPAPHPDYAAHIERALSAYESGRFAEARTAFRQAHDLVPTAKTLRTIGMCSFNLGDYLDALTNLEASLLDPRKPLTPQQRSQVSELISQSQRHVGRFRLKVTPADASLWVDGAPAVRSPSGELLLEPGRHELMAQAPGHRAGRSLLQVDGGDRTTLELRLEPQAGAARARQPGLTVTDLETGLRLPTDATPKAPSSTHPPVQTRGASFQRALGYVALGIAGAGLVTFGVSTGLATAKEEALDENCPSRQCAPPYHDEVDEFERLKLVSTASLIGTAALATLGVVLLVTDGATAPAERATTTAWIGLGSIGVRGAL